MAFQRNLSKIAAISAIIMGVSFSVSTAFGQEAESPEQVEKPVQEEVLKRPSPLGDIIFGDPNAKVTITEFSSITCNYCAQFHTEVFPKIKEKYIDTGLVKVIFRDLGYDPFATAGYMLARCEGNEKFPQIVDHFFKNQSRMFEKRQMGEILQELAKEAGIPKEKYLSCLADEKLLSAMKAVRDQAQELEITGTPAFFINGKKVIGFVSFEDMSAYIDSALKE